MAVTEIAFTMYPVTDMQRAIAFYRDALGLVPDDKGREYWVEFDIGGATFGVGNFEQIGTPGTAQSLALEVTDINGFRKKLAAAGVESSEPYETPICWISSLCDPDGNRIFLHQSKPR